MAEGRKEGKKRGDRPCASSEASTLESEVELIRILNKVALQQRPVFTTPNAVEIAIVVKVIDKLARSSD